jgi:hypothetical protein
VGCAAYHTTSTTIVEDNQGAIKFAKSGERGGRMRHIDMKHFFLNEKV